VAGDTRAGQILATGKHVVVIGGGDTGSDCIGTSIRQGAASVTNFELMPMPPEQENKALTWPYWPLKLRTSSSHEEGAERDFAVATKSFNGAAGKIESLTACHVEWVKDDKGAMAMKEVPGTEFTIPAQLVLLAMGYVHPVHEGLLAQLAVAKDRAAT
jgi:glutamate synthase (NADPH/NADH) small chain